MANDPHRDLLPVKDTDSRVGKGTNERVDHHLLSKLKRSELEDRYLRLSDENTQIKKQLHIQEEKIKRLGTKLLRLLNDKKNGTEPSSRKQFEESRAIDELQMRIVELEHENYTLKDKNIVLKQQLANHSRQHVAAHRSPVRSVHASPRMSQRQSSAPNINESSYTLSNRNPAAEQQLQEAESHIGALNEEIKSLHNKIDCLQQELEKSCLDNQRSKVTENIELIRLQRSLKQQAIQIAALQAQIKNAENNQKVLRDDLAKAHRENEEALQIVAEKQNEILDLYTKLEEKSLSRLEQEEMKERINDLMSERDSLKERSEFLMKTISSKTNDLENVNELKKQLALEKSKKEELSQDLESTKKMLQTLKNDSVSRKTSFDHLLHINTSPPKEQRLSLDAKTEISTQTSPERIKINSPRPRTPQQKELQLLASTQLHRPNSASSSKSHRSKEPNHDIMDSSFTAKVLDSLARTELNKMPNVGILKDNEDKTGSALKNGNSGRTKKGGKSVAITTPSPALSPAPCKCGMNSCGCSPIIFEDQRSESEYKKRSSPIPPPTPNERERKHFAEKMCLEREVDYLRQMLKSQAQRNESQQAEIKRLTYELKLNEEKYNDTLRRLDLHLKIFQHLELRMLQDDKNQFTEEQKANILSFASELTNPDGTSPNEIKKIEEPKEQKILPSSVPEQQIEAVFTEKKEPEKYISSEKEKKNEKLPEKDLEKGTIEERQEKKEDKVEKVLIIDEVDKVNKIDKMEKSSGSEKDSKRIDVKRIPSRGPRDSVVSRNPSEKEKLSTKDSETETKKRFVDRVFLSSSEEDSSSKDDESSEKEIANNTFDSSSKNSTPIGWKKKISYEKDGSPSPTQDPKSNNDAKHSTSSLVSSFPSESNLHFSRIKNRRETKPDLKLKKPMPKPRISTVESKIQLVTERSQSIQKEKSKPENSFVKIGIEWLKIEKDSSVWNDDDIRLLFVDFSFLDVQGEETETPDSLPKPRKPDEKCEYKFSKEIEINESRMSLLKSLVVNPKNDLIVFKVISDPEDFPDEVDCVDLGIAVVTVEKFFQHAVGGEVVILSVTSMNNSNEKIGTLCVTLKATGDILELH